MKWFMPLLLTGLLAVVGYGMWTAVNKGPGHGHAFFGGSADPAPGPDTNLQPPVIETVPPGAGPPTMVEPQPPAFGNPPLTGGDPLAGLPLDPGTSTGSGAIALATDNQDIPAPDSVETEFQAALRQAEAMLARDELDAAHRALSSWYADRGKLSAQSAEKLLDLLDQLAYEVVYSRKHLLARPHVVQENETAEQIAAQYQVPWALLGKINGISDPASLRPGETLKVVPGPFHGEINTSQFELTLLMEGGRYAGRFPIGLGSEVEAVEGDYAVSAKRVDPPYQQGMVGDPNNPLGHRLIVLEKESVQLAIHGTNDPASIGKPCKEGCIRLRPIDVENVYDILTAEKSHVSIRR